MKVLVTGARGQLGTEFVNFFESKGLDFVALGREELDITDFHKLYSVVREIKPDFVINCSAYNQVDRAEDEIQAAFRVNAVGVYNLAVVSREVGAKLIHYSTDYVFDGSKQGFYVEEDQPNPLNTYGKSKLLGEALIKDVAEDFLIFRVSWVYGRGRQNFLYKLYEWAKAREVLRIAVDEFSVPTSAKTIVEVTIRAIGDGLSGLYHLTNSGYASRYEWAKEYLELKGIKKLIYPAYQADFNLPARRPKWSVMSNERISGELKIEIPDWKEELKRRVNEGVI